MQDVCTFYHITHTVLYFLNSSSSLFYLISFSTWLLQLPRRDYYITLTTCYSYLLAQIPPYFLLFLHSTPLHSTPLPPPQSSLCLSQLPFPSSLSLVGVVTKRTIPLSSLILRCINDLRYLKKMQCIQFVINYLKSTYYHNNKIHRLPHNLNNKYCA